MADINRDEIERRIRRREPLRDLNLSSLKLDEMSLAGGVFRRCRFNDTTFLSTVLDAVRFEACILGGCDMRGASMREAALENCDLDGTNLQNSSLGIATGIMEPRKVLHSIRAL